MLTTITKLRAIFNARSILTTLRGRIIALTVVAAAGLGFAGAAPAMAHANQNTGPAVIRGYCPVEDEHGNVAYVQAGTQIGMFICGVDGNWHPVVF